MKKIVVKRVSGHSGVEWSMTTENGYGYTISYNKGVLTVSQGSPKATWSGMKLGKVIFLCSLEGREKNLSKTLTESQMKKILSPMFRFKKEESNV